MPDPVTLSSPSANSPTSGRWNDPSSVGASRALSDARDEDAAGEPGAGSAGHRRSHEDGRDCPHLHLYREGYDDKWAYPLPEDRFSDPDDRWRLFEEFMAYCNVTRVPNIPPRLFT